MRIIFFILLISSIAYPTYAVTVINSSFKNGGNGWQEVNPDEKSVSFSAKGHKDKKSIKLSGKGAYVAQLVDVKPNTNYQLSSYILGAGTIGAKADGKLFYESKKKLKKWTKATLDFNSGKTDKVAIFASFNSKEGRFDDFTLQEISANEANVSTSIISSSSGGYGLSPERAPGSNFELIDWYVSIPVDKNKDGKADNISERELVKGFQDKRFFYTAEDGGMVFRAPVKGAKTSKNTKYTRTELREMLRRGDKSIKTKGNGHNVNKNNWVFSSAPKLIQRDAGGVDGELYATLAVNHVTTTGKKGQLGRVIIGQIHAKKDEPIRLYYRKLPNNTKGSIYAAHEISGGDDVYYEILGSKDNNAKNPKEGFALNEKFSYKIIVSGNLLKVIISQDGKELGKAHIDMSNSGYDVADDYMYFKAGVYNQNNSGKDNDYVQATFYELKNSHKGYEY